MMPGGSLHELHRNAYLPLSGLGPYSPLCCCTPRFCSNALCGSENDKNGVMPAQASLLAASQALPCQDITITKFSVYMYEAQLYKEYELVCSK